MNALASAGARPVALAGLLDYAGLFPPARLPLPDAAAEYAALRTGELAWLVARFACPVARLSDLDAALAVDARPVPVAVIVAPAPWPAGVEAQLTTAAEGTARVVVEAVEAALPVPLPARADVEHVVAAVAERFPAVRDVFFEVPQHDVDAALDLLAGTGAGAKLRCGGLVPDAVPAPAVVASFLAGCARRGLRGKATAGLHRALRGPDPLLGVAAHGFLNVLAAAALAARGEPEAVLEAVIADAAPDPLVLDAAGFTWGTERFAADEIGAVRDRLVTAIGSCSVEEPVAALRKLGLLPG